MCIITVSTWASCGHRAQHVERCELASVSLGGNGDYTRCPDASTNTILHCPWLKRVPPLCPVSTDCMPFDYWSCCKCQHLLGPGSKGGNGYKGGLRQKKRIRRARFAPSFNARNAFTMLRRGRVCMADTSEEEASLASIAEVDESGDAEPKCGKDESADIASLNESFEALTLDADDMSDMEMDSSDPVDKEASMIDYSADSDDDMDADDADDADITDSTDLSAAHDDDGCNHARCDKCLQWRRCPCGCDCRRVISKTHRQCDRCTHNNCREHDANVTYLPAEEEIE